MYDINNSQFHSIREASLLDWLKSPACISLFLFMFGAMVLTGLGQQQALGILLVLAFTVAAMMRSLRGITPIPLEIKLFIAWVIWASLTGPIVAVSKWTLWYGGLRQILQVLVLITAVYGIARMHGERAFNAMMFGVIAGGILQALVVRNAGQVGGGLNAEAARAEGLTDNANTLGFMMNWTMLAAFMLWKQKGGKTHKLILMGTIVLMPILCFGLLASGSRKALVAFAFSLAAWFWYAIAPRERTKAVAWKMGVIAVIIALSGPVSVYVMQNTLAGKRMKAKLSGGGTMVTAEKKRYIMYIEGFEMTLKNPIMGVGVNQYKHHSSSGMYSHSNYIESLTTTGIPGFLLYQGIFFLPLFRAWRLTKTIHDTALIYQLKVIVVCCIAILLIGFGTPWYTSSTVMSFLALFSGYTYNYMQQVHYEQQHYYPARPMYA